MKKLKVTINRPKLSLKEIEDSKDFKTLLLQYKESQVIRPFYKELFFFGSLALVITLISLGIYISIDRVEKINAPVSRSERKPKSEVKAAIASMPAETTKEVNPEASEKNIIVVHKLPEQIKDSVPTSLSAEVNENEANNDKRKSELWSKVSTLNDEIVEAEKENISVQAKLRGYRFKLDVQPEEFPELSSYSSLLWEIGPEDENKNFHPSLLKEEWDEGKIKTTNEKNKYVLILKRKKTKYSFIVYPVKNLQSNQKLVQRRIDSLKSVREDLLKEYSKL